MLTSVLKDRPYILLTLAILFWAGNFILGRAFHNDIPPVALAFWRWTGASLLVALPALPHVRRDWAEIRRHWPAVLVLAILGITAFNTLAYSGLQYTQALNAFLIQSLMPVVIVLLSFLIFGERIQAKQALGIAISFCGAAIIIARGDLEQLLSLELNRGDGLVLGAIVCYAGYSVFLRKRPRVHPLAFIGVTFWLGTLILFPFYLWETFTVRALQPQPATFLVVGYVALFPSIVSYLCFNRGVELIGANRAGLFLHLMPVFGSLMAIAFLGERLMWYHGSGIGLIATGIYLATRNR